MSEPVFLSKAQYAELGEINPPPDEETILDESEPARGVRDPDRYIVQAKRLAMENFNEYRDPSRDPELALDEIFIVFFVKTFNGWKAQVGTTEVKGILWVISYNERTDLARLDVYRSIGKTKVKVNQ